jgi:hypothetical protein
MNADYSVTFQYSNTPVLQHSFYVFCRSQVSGFRVKKFRNCEFRNLGIEGILSIQFPNI